MSDIAYNPSRLVVVLENGVYINLGEVTSTEMQYTGTLSFYRDGVSIATIKNDDISAIVGSLKK